MSVQRNVSPFQVNRKKLWNFVKCIPKWPPNEAILPKKISGGGGPPDNPFQASNLRQKSSFRRKVYLKFTLLKTDFFFQINFGNCKFWKDLGHYLSFIAPVYFFQPIYNNHLLVYWVVNWITDLKTVRIEKSVRIIGPSLILGGT